MVLSREFFNVVNEALIIGCSFHDFSFVDNVYSVLGIYSLSALEVVSRRGCRVRCDATNGRGAHCNEFGLGNFIDI